MRNISVREKIYLEKQLPYIADDQIKGPYMDLFFHELVHDEEPARKYISKLLGVLVLLVNVILFPLIALGLMVSGILRVIEKETCVGYRGKEINLWKYRTRKQSGKSAAFGRLLKRTGLYKLPMGVNLIKGELLLAGPRPFSAEDSFAWNNTFDQFYKRYAVKPGFFIIGEWKSDPDVAEMEAILKKEFKYLYNPSISKDIDIVLGRFTGR